MILLATRKHLAEYHGKIHFDTTYVQYPKIKNDVSIMHLVSAQIDRKNIINQKEKINCVQLYLGVQYISESWKEITVNFISKQVSTIDAPQIESLRTFPAEVFELPWCSSQ